MDLVLIFIFLMSNKKFFSGTASATKLARNFVNDTSFLLYLADTIIPKNLTTHLENMINSNYEMSILSSQIMPYQIGNVGNIEVENNHVIKITEKDLNPKSPLGWSGIAFFKNNYIFKIIEKLNPSVGGEFEITDAMNILLNNNRKIRLCCDLLLCIPYFNASSKVVISYCLSHNLKIHHRKIKLRPYPS